MVHHLPRDRSRRSIDFLPYMLLACLVCGACATKPLVPFSEDTPARAGPNQTGRHSG